MKGYWKTKEGDILKTSEMTDSHLRNAIRMVIRNRIDKADINDLRDMDAFIRRLGTDRSMLTLLPEYNKRNFSLEEVSQYAAQCYSRRLGSFDNLSLQDWAKKVLNQDPKPRVKRKTDRIVKTQPLRIKDLPDDIFF